MDRWAEKLCHFPSQNKTWYAWLSSWLHDLVEWVSTLKKLDTQYAVKHCEEDSIERTYLTEEQEPKAIC